MPDQRNVAGLMCGDVLARLSDYLDGELPDSDRHSVEEHLRGCDWCERFGGECAAIVGAMRRELATPAPLEDDRERRLRARLASATRS